MTLRELFRAYREMIESGEYERSKIKEEATFNSILNVMIHNCKTCNKEFEVKPYEEKRGRGKFCSTECWYKYASNNHRVYTDEVRELVRAFWGVKTTAEIAQMLFVGEDGLKSQVSKWRSEGHNFPNLKQLAKQRREAAKRAPKPHKAPKPVKRRVPPPPKPKPVNKNGKPAKHDKLTNLERLKGSTKIHIAEHSRKIETVIRVDHKTYIIRHKKAS